MRDAAAGGAGVAASTREQGMTMKIGNIAIPRAVRGHKAS
jgi:hypothetical protein